MCENAIFMDQNLAQRLLVEGGTLILLNVPPGTDFGIDLKSWNTGEKFKGVKLIPPGFHYIHYSAVDKFGEMTPRVGFLHTFKKAELIAKSWDSREEGISSEVIPEEIIQSFKDNIKNADKFLGPYPYDIWKQWQELTSKIDTHIVERCSPVCGFVRSALELEHCTDACRPRGESSGLTKRRDVGLSAEDREQQLLPDLKPTPGTDLRFTELPGKKYPDGATPAEITKHSLDSSYALNSFLIKLKDPMEIIGEIQLAFVCFLVGQSFDAFEHWKKLVILICGADSVIPNRRLIYIEFLKTIEIQLSHVSEEILCDIVANNNFIYDSLRKLFASIALNSSVDDRLKCYVNHLRDRLTTKFFWDFSNLNEENGEEAPVIVDIP